MVTQHIVLDMTPGTKPVVNVSQYDTGARTLVFHLRQNRQTFTPPEGCTAIIHGIKPDSTYFSYAAEIDGDTVVADCTEQMTACVGFAECEVRLSNTEGHVGSANFLLNCEKSPMTGAVISESVIAAAEQLTARAEQAASSATASATAASESAEQARESATNAGESADRAAREAETASQAAEEAGESAVSAANSASSASGSEASARGFAEQAEGFAGEASESAQGAAQAAQTASAKASEAAASADRASGSAVDSANAANLASGYADTARAQAQAAEVSANNAAGSASTANTAAGTATTKAGEASQSASAANTSAGHAASSASAASASAENASASASAAATSAGSASGSATAAAGSASDASDSAAAALVSERAAAQSASDIAASAAQIQINTDNIAALQIVKSTSAADITSIDDGADGVPMKSLKVYIEPQQDLHGYDNPWPAGGGKNQLKNNLTSGETNGLTITVDADGVISFSGTTNDITILNVNADIDTEFQRNTNYVLSGCTGGNFYTYRLEIYKQVGNNATNYNGDTQFQIYDTDSGCICRIVIQSETSMSGIKIYPMIRLATETDASFAPYSNICPISGWDSVETVRTDANGGNRLTITTDLPSTVYGGVLDVISGELTVDRAMIASYAGETLPGEWISDRDVYSAGATPTTGAQVVYMLATPTTYTLTPEEVKTLLKANNVFADAGQTAIVYVADPKTYIDNTIADAVASLT